MTDSNIRRAPQQICWKPLAPLPECYGLAVFTMARVGHMRRRELLGALGATAVTWPLAHTDSSRRSCRSSGSGHEHAFIMEPMGGRFCAAPARSRLIEGRTVAIEYRWAEGRNERFTEIGAEFVRLKVDLIVTSGGAVLAAKQATSVIPIVFAVANDPVAAPGRESGRRAATSPDCRSRRPMLPASGSNSCARLSPVSAGWRSWPMLAILPPGWR